MSEIDLSASGMLRRSIGLLRTHPLPFLLPPLLVAILTGGGNQRHASPSWESWRDLNTIDPLSVLPFYALVATIVTVVVVALVVIALVVMLLVVVAGVAYTATSRCLLDHLSTGQRPDWMASLRGVRDRWLQLGWTYFLACLLVLLGLVAIVVPGVILLAGFLPLFSVLADGRTSGRAALRRAWAISRGHKGALALLVLGGVLVEVLVSATLAWIPIVGWLFAVAATGGVTAVWLASGAILYKEANVPNAPAGP